MVSFLCLPPTPLPFLPLLKEEDDQLVHHNKNGAVALVAQRRMIMIMVPVGGFIQSSSICCHPPPPWVWDRHCNTILLSAGISSKEEDGVLVWSGGIAHSCTLNNHLWQDWTAGPLAYWSHLLHVKLLGSLWWLVVYWKALVNKVAWWQVNSMLSTKAGFFGRQIVT